jgi:hypothetical protein
MIVTIKLDLGPRTSFSKPEPKAEPKEGRRIVSREQRDARIGLWLEESAREQPWNGLDARVQRKG